MAKSAGVDIGSVTTKCVIVDDGRMIARAIRKTGVDSEKSAAFVFNEALREASLNAEEIAGIVSTGYGRRLFKSADKVITEISAGGYGGYVLAGRKECLIIDVGGQDTKIIEVNEKGEVVDFLMNDKCAAGTGRFLEMMAEVLETNFEGLSELAMNSRNPVPINSTCSVFAESEVVSLISQAVKKEDIAGGLINAIAVRVSSMAGQFRHNQLILFCGGGAKSGALKMSIENTMGRKIQVLDNPQFVVAYGAAIYQYRGEK